MNRQGRVRLNLMRKGLILIPMEENVLHGRVQGSTTFYWTQGAPTTAVNKNTDPAVLRAVGKFHCQRQRKWFLWDFLLDTNSLSSTIRSMDNLCAL